MNDPSSLSTLGLVVLALASLASLAVSVKNLLPAKPNGSNGNGSHDITRREFEEVKTYQRETAHEIRDRMQRLEVQIALLSHNRRRHPPEAHPEIKP